MDNPLRLRQPTRSHKLPDAPLGSSSLPPVSQQNGKDTADESNKSKSKFFLCDRTLVVLLSCIIFWSSIFAFVNDKGDIPTVQVTKAPMGTIIYGAKSKSDDTARLVKEAIQVGFRHIATVSFVTIISDIRNMCMHILSSCFLIDIIHPCN